MLHDSVISGRDRRGTAEERRRSPRAPVHAELVVAWHHDPDTVVRYPVVDMGDGGMRILSALPLPRGMSGTAIKLLPEGRTLNRMCTVSWSRSPAEGGPFEVGLAISH